MSLQQGLFDHTMTMWTHAYIMLYVGEREVGGGQG